MGKRGATRSVANPCRIRILWGECRTDGASRRPYFWFRNPFRKIAEAERFELSIPCGMPPFQGGALDHYATPPMHIKNTLFIPFRPEPRCGPLPAGGS